MKQHFIPLAAALFLGLGLPFMAALDVQAQEQPAFGKWQYLAISLGGEAKEATRRLNELASEGWQYVGPLGHDLVAFKRAATPAKNVATAEVAGLVTVNGKPLDSGVITFLPIDSKTASAGGEIKEGKYSVRVPVGTMQVGISAAKIIGKKKLNDKADSPEVPILAELLPARYNAASELRFEVVPGKNQGDFDLRSK